MTDDTIKMTLPTIIGLCITVLLYLLIDLNNYNHMFLSSLPMMGGVILSVIFTFKSIKQDKISLEKSNPLILKDQNLMILIGVMIGATPLILFMVYILMELL